MSRNGRRSKREFEDRAVIKLLESPHNVVDLLRIVAADVAELLDFSRAEPVPRKEIRSDLIEEELDVAYRIPFRDGGRSVWVTVLVEHQSRADRMMGYRLLRFMVALWLAQSERWRRDRVPERLQRLDPVVPVVLYTGRSKWKKPIGVETLMDLPDGLRCYVPSFSTLLLPLSETPAERLGESALSAALLGLKTSEGRRESFAPAFRSALKILDALPDEQHAEWVRALEFLYQTVMERRSPAEREELSGALEEIFRPERRSEAQEVIVTIADELRQEGEAIGVAKGEAIGVAKGEAIGVAKGEAIGVAKGEAIGVAKGRVEGQRGLLLRMLELKFGSVPPGLAAAVESLQDDQIDAVSVRLLQANSLGDLGLAV